MRSDQGLEDFIKLIKVNFPVSEFYIAKDVGKLPDLVAEREAAVYDLEHAIVEYLRGNNQS